MWSLKSELSLPLFFSVNFSSINLIIFPPVMYKSIVVFYPTPDLARSSVVLHMQIDLFAVSNRMLWESVLLYYLVTSCRLYESENFLHVCWDQIIYAFLSGCISIICIVEGILLLKPWECVLLLVIFLLYSVVMLGYIVCGSVSELVIIYYLNGTFVCNKYELVNP